MNIPFQHKLKEKYLNLEFPVFFISLHVVLTNDIDQSLDKRRDELILPDAKYSALHYRGDSKNPSIIFLPDDAGPGLIAHEVWHFVRHMLDRSEATLENEVVAYHIQYITDEIWKRLKQINGKRKPKRP